MTCKTQAERREKLELERMLEEMSSNHITWLMNDDKEMLDLRKKKVGLHRYSNGSRSGDPTKRSSYTAAEIIRGDAGVEWRDALKASIEAGVISAASTTGTPKLEVRNCAGGVRAETIGGGKKIVGYAAVFGQLSEPLRVGNRTVREMVMPGAFTKCLAGSPDLRALVNHDARLVLARTTSGTLRVLTDSHGLRYDLDVPPTSYGSDLAISLERGDISQSSFGFYTVDDAYVPGDDGMMVRELRAVNLFEISPCTFPAYTGSFSGVMN
jgi:uncharacterized protein